MVDGVAAVDIGQVILDTSPDPRDAPPDTWRPAREPSHVELVAGAIAELARRPSAFVDTVRTGVVDLRSVAGRLAGAAGGMFAMMRTAARSAPASPLNAAIGAQRRYATATTDLDDYRRIRKAHGGTINDVALAVVAGALRSWLLTRGEPVTAATSVRALVPVSVRGGDDPGAVGNRVASYLVDLPVGE